MKKVLYFYSTLLLVIFFSVQINAQVTNLVVIGASPGGHFTLESGGELVWSFNVPNNGDTSLVQIWLDINKNGSIDSGDKIFQLV